MAQAPQPIIRVEHLVAGYGESVVLDNISFEVGRGEIFGILGGSGSGKSTLLKHMIGLNPPLGGRIFLDDDDIWAAPGTERLNILRRIGVAYQSGALFGSMTLLQNVSLPLEELTDLPADARELVARMKLRMVGLEPFAKHMPAEVSGGMQKRVAIARAMALDPAVVFLDEPSAGLDPITSMELDQLILDLAGTLEVTFVVVTHELPSVFTIADRVILLDGRNKCIAAEGPPKELRDESKTHWVRRFLRRELAKES